MRSFACPLLVCISLLYPQCSHAAWYQVEVIVFQYVQPDVAGEQWFNNPGLPDRQNSIELMSELPDQVLQPQQSLAGEAEPGSELESEPEPEPEPEPEQTRSAFVALAESEFRLQGVARVLRLAREYRPLLHVAWQQPGLSSGEGPAVYVEADAEPDAESMMNRGENTAVTDSADPLTIDRAVTEGTILLRSSRFLHVDVDLVFFPEPEMGVTTPVAQSTGSTPQSPLRNSQADYVRLIESRRIKLNELHYFDHPLFGVILQVSRLN